MVSCQRGWKELRGWKEIDNSELEELVTQATRMCFHLTEKKVIVRIRNSSDQEFAFDLFDKRIIEAAGFTEADINSAIPIDTFFYFPGSTYPETTLTGRVLAREKHPWGGSLGLNMLIENNTPGTISFQIAAAHDTYGHRAGPWKEIPHWNVYLKIIDPRRGFTPEDPQVIPVPWDWVHALKDSDVLFISMIPINPKGDQKDGKIERPMFGP